MVVRVVDFDFEVEVGVVDFVEDCVGEDNLDKMDKMGRMDVGEETGLARKTQVHGLGQQGSPL